MSNPLSKEMLSNPVTGLLFKGHNQDFLKGAPTAALS